MKEVFPKPPFMEFKRQKNLRDLLIKARVPPASRAHLQRQNKGLSQCGLKCTACPYLKPGTQIKTSPNKYWNINKKVNCQSFNVVYLIERDKDNCRQQYVGETGRIFKF